MYINAGSSYLRYDPTGRKRKKRKTKGEVYQKLQNKKFVEMKPKESYQQQRSAETKNIQSVEILSHKCEKLDRQYYTGDFVIGIATMHKSNAVPITNVDHAKDIARMRR